MGQQELIQEKRRESLAGSGRTPFPRGAGNGLAGFIGASGRGRNCKGLKARIQERVLKEAAPRGEMGGA